MEQGTDYSKWTTDELINRVTSLEQQLKSQTLKTSTLPTLADVPSPSRKPKVGRVYRKFDTSKYSTRLIALKFAYLGQRYNGLEFHPNNATPLPTVEEELWKALNKARLVFPTPNSLLEPDEPNWEGCEYSKCGRTDKGVSAFGQVVSLRVRSNRPLSRDIAADPHDEAISRDSRDVELPRSLGPAIDIEGSQSPALQSPAIVLSSETPPFHPIHDEIPYIQILNRILAPDIRILAWCPNLTPDFSARFSCKERQYRYFFTQPAFAPTTTPPSTSPPKQKPEGYLDIPTMRTAAHKFIGLHDFRNFCKTDASKQIENFERRIFHADIIPINPNPPSPSPSPSSSPTPNPPPTLTTPQTFAFTLHGSAFLWHQVRHMIAILFLIGQGLESPSLIDTLLDIRTTPCKPQYEMADDAPLVLWDCIFPAKDSTSRTDALEWIYAGATTPSNGNGKQPVAGDLLSDIWRVWRGHKIDEILAGTLLNIASDQSSRADMTNPQQSRSQKVFQGGDAPKSAGRYIPVMQKPRMESVEVINARFRKRKGKGAEDEKMGGGAAIEKEGVGGEGLED